MPTSGTLRKSLPCKVPVMHAYQATYTVCNRTLYTLMSLYMYHELDI